MRPGMGPLLWSLSIKWEEPLWATTIPVFLITSGFVQFQKFLCDETGLSRNRYFQCQCVVAINAKVMIILLQSQGFCRDLVQCVGSA